MADSSGTPNWDDLFPPDQSGGAGIIPDNPPPSFTDSTTVTAPDPGDNWPGPQPPDSGMAYPSPQEVDLGTGLPDWLKNIFKDNTPTTGGGGTNPGSSSRAKQALMALLPLLPFLKQLLSGNPNSALSSAQAQTQKQLNEQLALMTDRYKSTIPVHDAAMRLAMQLAPSGTPSPGLLASVGESAQPHGQATLHPEVVSAIETMMAHTPRG
jgi:hypothetical protein